MIASLLAVGLAVAEEPPVGGPWVFVVNPTFDMESGVRTLDGLGRLAFEYDRALAGVVRIDETTALGKTAGISGRLAKGLLVDMPLVATEALVRHEVWGHGARGREVDLDVQYEFHLVRPYSLFLSDRDVEEPLGFAEVGGVRQLDRDITVTFGGIESDYTAARWIQLGMVRRQGWMHYRDMLAYGVGRFSYFGSLASDLGSIDATRPSNDAGAYVTSLQRQFNRWRPADREAIAQNLRVAYLVGFVDPTLWLAAFHGTWTYGIQGEREARLPSWRVGDFDVYPATGFALTPFGAEHQVDLFARRNDVTFDVYARGGSSGLASYWGLGARAFGFQVGPHGELGAELDLWRQPDTILDHRFVFDRGDRLGGNAAVHVDWGLHSQVGVVAKLAAKTEGYLMAQPIDRAIYGYLGLSIRPERAR